MAGLFQMPSPEMVRQSARQGLFKQAQQVAAAPAGRGFVQAAAQAGGLFGEALGRGMGGTAPGEIETQKFQQVQQQIQDKYKDADLADPNVQIQMMGDSAKLLMDAGFGDQAAQALEMANQIRESLPKDATLMGQLVQVPGAPEGTLGQLDLSSGEWDIKVKPKGKGQEFNFVENPWEKAVAKGFEETLKEVPSAIKSINTAETMTKMLESPMMTGKTANIQLAVGAFMKDIGAWDDSKDLVANTQTYISQSGKQTAQVIRDFGSGTGLSDADREYANMIAGGNISVDAKALRDINRLNIVAAVNKLSDYNRQVMQARLPEDRKRELLQPIPPKYQAIADKYNNTFGKNNISSVKGFSGKKKAEPKERPQQPTDIPKGWSVREK